MKSKSYFLLIGFLVMHGFAGVSSITDTTGGEIFPLIAQGESLSGNAGKWPQFRGPNRDGKSPETGLLNVWPEAGPKLIRTISGPGGLAAYRTDNGERVWQVELVDRLGGRVPMWGYAESVLIDGNKLICTPGGEKTATFAALDKNSGRLLWTSGELTERAEYASPILIEYNNIRQIVSMTRGGLIAVSPENGKLIWRYNRPANRITTETFTANCNTPVYADGYLFEATGFQSKGGGAVRLRPTVTGIEVEPVWDTREIDCEHGGYVLVDGYIYTNDGRGWSCIELKTGRKAWTGIGPGKGSVLYADGMLYCLGDRGKVGLLAANPAAYKMISTFDLPKGNGPSWTHPVINEGKLYLRWDNNLYVYDIRK